MSASIRWGILSTGRIAGVFARGLAGSSTGKLVAVASRTQTAADTFAAAHGGVRAHGSYEALLADPDVDAVYIATPHPQHAEWAVKAAEAGKHLLCEKPLTVSLAGAQRVVAAARRARIVLMEAFMYRCHPQTQREILNTATARSLVILDEIGRGTSTYDGLSLAWAVVEHLHDQIGCRTLFATHYHELTQLSKELPQLANFNVAVREWQDQVVFLHQIVPGAAEKSFGIHVAQLAGVPREVNQRAEQILASLEKGSAAASLDRSHEVELSRGNEAPGESGESGDLKPARRRKASQLQMTLFEYSEHPLLEAIRGVDLDVTTPRDAMNLIDHWQGQLLAESNGPAQTA